MTPSRLSRAFVRAAGVPPSLYLKAQCLARAQELLRTTALSLNDIACRSGFGTPVTFFRAFRRATGETPAMYRLRRGQQRHRYCK